MPSSRVAVLQAPRRFVIERRPTPAAHDGDAVVRVAATAVCHTDLEIYAGRHPGVRLPVVMGHEATGVVEAVGPGVTRVRPGQRVLVNPIIACGACEACARGRGNLCRRAGLLGRESDGALAEHVTLPARYLYPLPDHLPLASATLIETLATVRHAQRRAGLGAGEAVVVLGQGAAGLLHTRLAKLAGASPVVAVSRSAWKFDLARRMGADLVVDGAARDVVADVREATAGRGADVVIDATGRSWLMPLAMEMLAPGGKLVAYGISQEAVSGFTTFPLYFKELTIYGSRALTPEDVQPSIDLVAARAVDVEPFVTRHYPLEGVAAAFEEYERAPETILRLVIAPGE
jgi:2-desacetyl-2-hydroxyethyl bacteriochlorophyllide A dehydrogenase